MPSVRSTTTGRRVRLLAVLALIAIVVPVSGALVVVARSRRAVAHQILDGELALANSVAGSLGQNLAEARQELRQLASSAPVHDGVAHGDPAALRTELADVLNISPLFRSMDVRISGGPTVSVGKAIPGDLRITAPITIDGRKTAELDGAVSIVDAVSGRSALTRGKSGSGSVVDREGNVLFQTDARSKNTRVRTPKVLRLIGAWKPATAQYRSVTLNLNRLTAFVPVANENIAITVGIDETEALAPANRLAFLLLLGIAAFVIAAGVITFLVARSLWRAEERLHGQAERERLASQKLAESEERYRATVRELPDAVSVFGAVRDDTGDIVDFEWTYANPAACAMTGFGAGQLEGHTLLEMQPDHRNSDTFETYRTIVETGVPFEDDTLWYEGDWGNGTRSRRAFDVRATKVRDGFVIVSREVTELREHSAQLAEIADEQKRLNDLKSEFVGVVAHDLRSPLTIITGFVNEIEQSGMKDPEESMWFVRRIGAAADRMTDLVRDALDVTAIESGEYQLASNRFDLSALAGETVHELSTVHPDAQISYANESGLVPAVGDVDAYRRVLVNLITNAIKYAGGACAVSITPSDGGYATVTVTDNGTGIPSDKLELVFQRFSRLPGTKQSGTGLGLYICRKIVEQQGGRIWATSAVGEGSKFSFTVPASVTGAHTAA